MIFTEEQDGHVYRVEFITSHDMRFNQYGKCWPVTTQCVIYHGQRILAFAEVIKHRKDTDNPKYAMVYAAKKAFAKVRLWREIRTRFWAKILAD